MEKPFKYFVLCNKTKKILYRTNQAPDLFSLQTYESIDGTGTTVLVQTKTAYVDTRYVAKLRLFNYLTFTKKGLELPRYNPFKSTTLPILNF